MTGRTAGCFRAARIGVLLTVPWAPAWGDTMVDRPDAEQSGS